MVVVLKTGLWRERTMGGLGRRTSRPASSVVSAFSEGAVGGGGEGGGREVRGEYVSVTEIRDRGMTHRA